MTTPYDTIKTRLKTLLQSERTIEFLNNLTNFGLGLGNPQINNKFIKKVFQGNNIIIENRHNRKKFINNIIIDNKKNLLRTNSITNRHINFKTYAYEREDEFDFSNTKEQINNELDTFHYFLIIKIEEVYNEVLDELKVCYHYYLFPSEDFKIKKNFPFLNRSSFSGVNWTFRKFKDFCFKYNEEFLIKYNICSPYISY